MSATLSDAARCRKNGWKVGDVLRSLDGKVPAMRITAIGEREILARRLDGCCESMWCLWYRRWRKVRRGGAR